MGDLLFFLKKSLYHITYWQNLTQSLPYLISNDLCTCKHNIGPDTGLVSKVALSFHYYNNFLPTNIYQYSYFYNKVEQNCCVKSIACLLFY